MDTDQQFDPVDVSRLIAEALNERTVLPLSFIETSVFEHLSHMLTQYMNAADVSYVISELRSYLFQGFTKFSPKQLHDIIKHCRKCDNVEHPPILPSWNCSDPDLMILAENPSSIGQYSQILVDSLKDAGFSSQRCILTYVTRCKAYKPDNLIVSNCLPYIHTEIAALNPKLILPLGLTAYTAITGDSSVKLSDIRGSIRWVGPYAILPEASLAWGAHAKNKDTTQKSYMHASLTKAHHFLYGGNN
jgi:hypothetical protein